MKSALQYLLFLGLLAGALSCGSESANSTGEFAAIDTAHSLQVATGSIYRYRISSQFVDDRNVDIWLPENYSQTKRYAVLYMHDGQMLFDSTQTWNGQEWTVDETAGSLIRQNRIRDVIVVGIWNNGDRRHAEYFPQKAISNIPSPRQDSLLKLMGDRPRADDYLRFLVTELKPFVDQNYATHHDRQHTFVMGSSMGGLISLYAISEYPEVFGGAACLSTHWIGGFNANEAVPKAINDYLKANLPDPQNHKIYFDHGTETLDAHYPPHQDLIDQTMKANGFSTKNWRSREFPGADHSEHSWAQRLDVPLLFLLKNK